MQTPNMLFTCLSDSSNEVDRSCNESNKYSNGILFTFHILGGQRWIRIPAIVYSSHVITTVYYMLAEWYFGEFIQDRDFPGPESFNERVIVSMFYLPYFIIPLMILTTMLFSSEYKPYDYEHGKSKYP
ncbi:putative transmembrane protein [Apostichopus japonicus]|uniref:Putative transmembrane protein n=1 Tax=Stichopus japonicus TaxID=307972 RepID=A0A2G8KDV9_STIJA|nr:putative transmembrane protein [Apostichopus japonicus]